MKSNAENFRTSDGAYCRCCGSQDVMTIDVSIEQSDDFDRRSRLRVTRLWLAFADLSEFELSAFICDAESYIDIEYFNDIEIGLFSYLSDNIEQIGERRPSCDPDSFYRLHMIDTLNADEMLARRKLAFMRIWDSFDESTKTSFAQRVLGHIPRKFRPESS
ncbi:hypothetical protein [Tropicimonas aquimaris]|uniref:Uncharacterized protein n=1 Tax=Tropicimonas aquimaris TaxID=914152 RepID=A0ABW3ISA0_9RHOB